MYVYIPATGAHNLLPSPVWVGLLHATSSCLYTACRLPRHSRSGPVLTIFLMTLQNTFHSSRNLTKKGLKVVCDLLYDKVIVHSC